MSLFDGKRTLGEIVTVLMIASVVTWFTHRPAPQVAAEMKAYNLTQDQAEKALRLVRERELKAASPQIAATMIKYDLTREQVDRAVEIMKSREQAR